MSMNSERINVPRSPQHVDSLATISCIILAIVTLSFAAFRFAGVLPTGASHNVDKAFFSSVNLVTLTGFAQSFAAVSEYPPAGKWMIAGVAFVSAATILVGSGAFLVRIFGVKISGFQLTMYSLALLVLGFLIGLAGGPFDAVSSSTGMGLTSIRSPERWIEACLVTASLPASLGPILVLGLLGLRSPTCRAETFGLCWILLALCYLVGLLVLQMGGASWTDASLLSLDTRSLGSGFVIVNDQNKANQWLMIGSMLLGAGPGSVAGGLSVLPIAVVLGAAWGSLRGAVVDPVLGVAVVWIGMLFVGLFALVIALASTQPQLPGDRLLFLAVSAICNVGLSHDPVSLPREGLYLLSTAMLWGRLLPMAMLCWMACIADRKSQLPVALPAIGSD